MRTIAVALALTAVGAGLVLAGLALDSYNRGSCPAIPYPPPKGGGGCDHTMTLYGVTFWIGATSQKLVAGGAALLLLCAALGLYVLRNRPAPPNGSAMR